MVRLILLFIVFKNNMISYETYSGAIDIPDGRDIPAQEFLTTIPLPSSVLLKRTPVLNQGRIGACTVFWVTASLFETAAKDAERNWIPFNALYDVWNMWSKAKTRWASDTGWWSLQGAIQLIKDMRYSVGYARLCYAANANIQDMKLALANDYALYTGSSHWDWSKIGQTHIYSEKAEFAGHAFCIVGYDDGESRFIAKNSWWEGWGDNGYFYIPYSLVKTLYSVYIQLDASDADALKDFRNNLATLYASKAQQAWIWNGSSPDAIATDFEIATMCGRALKLPLSQNRAFWASTFNELIVRDKAILNIWNTRQGQTLATDKEIATMFTRAVKREATSTSWILTRRQVAVVVGRDLM